MPRIPIAAGAYQSRSIISGSQRQINLTNEVNEDPQAPAPVTLFPTPGLFRLAAPPATGATRCLFRASNGELFQVVNDKVYYIDVNYAYVLLGTITYHPTMVLMKDNGLVIVLVTGVLNEGWAIQMSDHQFGLISDPNFFGGTFVDYVDTYFILDTPGLNEWQISLALVTYDNLVNGVITPDTLYPAFDPLDVVSKSGSPDPIAGLAVMHRNLWTIGTLTTEVWYDAGAADFAFGSIPGTYIEFGCIAAYSIAHSENNIFWLSQNREGARIVLQGTADFKVQEISAKGLEAIIGQFAIVHDAVGGCYQLLGHLYYVLTFPSAGRSFMCEVKTKQWTELAFTGQNGLERHRAIAWAFAYEKNLCADYQDGTLYQLRPDVFTDGDSPITRLRTVPHILADGKRIRINRLIADLQGGTLEGETGPLVFLRVSTDRGGSWSDAMEATIGDTGDYGVLPFWTMLGLGRDWVFEISWSAPINTAFNGVFIEATPAGS